MLACTFLAPIALLAIPRRRDPPLILSQDFFLANQGSFFLPSGGLGLARGLLYIYGLLSPFRLQLCFRAIPIQLNFI